MASLVSGQFSFFQSFQVLALFLSGTSVASLPFFPLSSPFLLPPLIYLVFFFSNMCNMAHSFSFMETIIYKLNFKEMYLRIKNKLGSFPTIGFQRCFIFQEIYLYFSESILFKCLFINYNDTKKYFHLVIAGNIT